MKITDIIKKSEKTLFSFEIVPPVKGKSIEDFFENVSPLIEFKPPFIDVTTSREQIVYKPQNDGSHSKRIIRSRPGTVGICASLMFRFDTIAVPHVLCGGFTKEETEYMLIDLQYLGIKNVLALRGDSRNDQKFFEPHPNGNNHAIDLVKQVKALSNGDFLDGSIPGAFSDFCIGVAGYPEKHFEAANLSTDIQHLKAKVDAGAEYIVTQMFFDNQIYFDFVDKCRKAGITVPIIPGIKPLTSLSQINILPQVFNLDFPTELAKEFSKCKDNKQMKQLGIEWGIAQSKELYKRNVPTIHFYSMGKSTSVYEIAKAIF